MRDKLWILLQISLGGYVVGRTGGDELEKPVHEVSIAERVKHYKWGGKAKWIHKLSPVFEYKINYAFSLLERNSYYGGLAGTSDEARLKALNYYGYYTGSFYPWERLIGRGVFGLN